jgi:hypothetical protein
VSTHSCGRNVDPGVILPNFIWTLSKLSPRLDYLSSEIPPTPEPSHPLIRRFGGYIHSFLPQFSLFSVDRNSFRQPDHSITIGLLLKWSDGRRLEEVLATKVCRAARLPTPKIISYGERADNASRHSSNPDDMTTGAVNLAKRTNHSARRQKPLLLQSSTLPFGGRQVPEARNEFALSQAVQSAASASQIIHSVLAKRYEFLITAGAQQYLEETECEKR